MELSKVQAVIENAPKGANIILEWTRAVKTRAGVSEAVTKFVRMIGRIGIEYDNIGTVVEKRQNGDLPKENAGLQDWQKWVQYPYLLAHKTNGTLYVRLYKGTSAKVRPAVQFFIDGTEATREQITPLVPKAEAEPSKSETDCFTLKLDALDRVYSESADYTA